PDIWNVPSDDFRTKFGVADVGREGLNMNGIIEPFTEDPVRKDHRVFIVVSFPGHVSDQEVLSKGEFSVSYSRSIAEHLSFFHFVSCFHDWSHVDTGGLVGTLVVGKFVDLLFSVFVENADLRSVNGLNDPFTLSDRYVAGTGSGGAFHPSPDDRRCGTNEGNGLSLHVGSHRSTGIVIVFQEWNERGRSRNNLLRRNINTLDVVHMR